MRGPPPLPWYQAYSPKILSRTVTAANARHRLRRRDSIMERSLVHFEQEDPYNNPCSTKEFAASERLCLSGAISEPHSDSAIWKQKPWQYVEGTQENRTLRP